MRRNAIEVVSKCHTWRESLRQHIVGSDISQEDSTEGSKCEGLLTPGWPELLIIWLSLPSGPEITDVHHHFWLREILS